MLTAPNRQRPTSGAPDAPSLMLFSCVFGIAAALTLQATPVQERFALQPVPRTAAELSKRFTPAQVDILEKLNRRDREHLIRIDPPVPGIVVPTTWEEDERVYSPFPREWAAAASHPKFTRSRRSTDNDAWLLEWYFNFINARGVSFHQFELPGYAASHACVRLLQRDAQWLFGWGDQWVLSDDKRTVPQPGTPVLVIGQFAHGKPGPWTSLTFLETLIELPDPSVRQALARRATFTAARAHFSSSGLLSSTDSGTA